MVTTFNFQTERLTVQSWEMSVGDPAELRELSEELRRILSPTVLAFLPPNMQLSVAEDPILPWIQDRHAESDVLEVRNSDRLIGLVILAFDDAAMGGAKVHIGYLLVEDFWGQGYASELVEGLVNALAMKAPIEIIGGVDTGNAASARVLEKVGFIKQSESVSGDTVKYSLELKAAS